MEKLKKYFGEYDMTWKKVIIFAIITAIVCAGLNCIPALDDTSFQDIAISFECWILFAVFIIMNCDKWWEASLKTFVFFLISQPLIYLLEVPFKAAGWSLFQYYGHWFILTVLTLPGAAIAFLVKKKNWLSVAVLSVATGFLAYMAQDYFYAALARFPHHLLSSIFCLALAIFLVLVLFDEKKHKLAALAIIFVILIGTAIFFKPVTKQCISLGEGEWSYTIDDESVISVEMSEDNTATLHAEGEGSTILSFENSDGTIEEYCVSVSGGGIFVSPVG